MVTYIKVFISIALFITISFLIVSAMQISFLEDPSKLMGSGGVATAAFGIFLLIADVVLPVPSSLIMIANGAFFGLTIGMLLSIVGGVGASIVGYLLGRSGSSYINRIVSESDRNKATSLMNKYGMMALIVSRSIPVVSETMSIIAGMTNVHPWRMVIASFLGIIPAAAIYAITGAFAMNIESGFWSFILVLAIAGLFWLLNKLVFNMK